MGWAFRPSDKLPTRTWGKLAKWNYILETLKMENIASRKLEKHGDIDLEYIAEEDLDVMIVGDWSDNWLGYTKESNELAKSMVKALLRDPCRECRVLVLLWLRWSAPRETCNRYNLPAA